MEAGKTTMILKPLLLGLAALALAALPLRAQTLPAEQFVAEASVSNMFAIEAGTLALQKSNSPEIKKFAHQTVNDRTTLGTGLRQILAKRSGISAPEMPDDKRQAILRELSNLQGPEFDRAYVLAQQKANEEAEALFSSYAQAGTDEELKTFASKNLPTMQDYAKQAKALPVTN
jgi:putative membrane protein